MAALDAIDRDALGEAQQHLRTALEWPEHLGQGRPYDPEERLQQYLLGVVGQRLGQREQARAAFNAVVDATNFTEANPTPLDLLVIPSLSALGRDVSAASARLAGTRAEDAGGLAGQLLGRALEVSR